MTNDPTEPVVASRTVWMAVLGLTRHTDMALSDKIAGVGIQRNEWGTHPWLVLRLKLIRAVKNAFEQETAAKLTLSAGSDVPEADVEIDVTDAEALFMDMSIQETAFKGALTLKKELWRAIATLA